MILFDILEEHIEEADFLWQQRANALASHDYTLDELAEVEERLLAHLDGLVLGEKAAWGLIEPKLMGGGEVGEVFAAAFVALDSGDSARVEAVATSGHPAAAVAGEDDEELVEDPDEGLPWPDPEKLAAWWRTNASRFEKSGRYRDGKPYGRDALLDTLRYGHLLARHHAACELALLDPKVPYIETQAFARQQKFGLADH